MNASLVVTRIAALGGAAPAAPIDALRIGSAQPTRATDLPRVVVAVTDARTGGVGLGRVVGEKVVVGPRDDLVPVLTSRGFSGDFRSLDLPAMPRAVPPAVVPDVSVQNVTDPAQPRAYRAVGAPAAGDEFRVDEARGRLVFGAPQSVGALLAVRYHATMPAGTVHAVRCRGRVTLRLWTATAEGGATLADALATRLADAALTRSVGFLRLSPAGLEPGAPTRVDTGETSAFTAWSRTMAYDFILEAEDERSDGDGGVIRRIDVVLPGATPDALSVPAAITT